ncbi:hypothetical protein FF38_07832 [Lucilia cuprina]|uniref:Uncharacterized protein n=1 Tax=Lucilia cuprina TaxID=7375 RepID=A0A0L0CE30_LUCCU|nr:hypothetical protein FF38_07832 [Lucilia cuprina]
MSETREQILEEIKLQGDLVRKLKAAKEPKEKCVDYNCILLQQSAVVPPYYEFTCFEIKTTTL